MRASQFSDILVGHGEGPVWWPEDGLRICDGFAGRIVSIDENGREAGSIHVGSFVGAFRPRVGGGLVAAAERSFVLVDPGGSRRDLGELWSDTGIRMNDGGCDPQGRFYCGSMPSAGDRPVGVLYRLDTDGRVTPVLEDLSCPNGMVYSADGQTVYYIDTPTQRVDAFDVDEAGEWQNRRVAVPNIQGGSPDGMTIDANGNLWVALWGGSGVRCFDPGTGEQLAAIEVEGASQTSACTFGGADLDRLYITTSTDGGAGGPKAGAVFVAEPGVRGVLPAVYAG
ncbi:SMP-30/gluconolactonase/LRE family protein [Microlunatus panaciterrae]|uniref:Sugar lactone lactonase YvrE n=1 Tax=Microlunatus panaciterrae TaxID=400768 RepID=A0ABS2RH87_9ACTN|nr:SMP-30/gluconolactonase/LRE family protein [Microlunatus panaciterrae]MBM7798374.1 sugar lactone lactonase YvrE [Microlunatus panaciterrae]